jgi:hypothetical protein
VSCASGVAGVLVSAGVPVSAPASVDASVVAASAASEPVPFEPSEPSEPCDWDAPSEAVSESVLSDAA